MKSLVLSACLALAAPLAQAATVDPAAAIRLGTLQTWPSGYNVSYTLDFGALPGTADGLRTWSLTATAAPGAFFTTAWVNGTSDPAVCQWNAPLSIAVDKREATFTSGCVATPDKSFTFFLQGQGRFAAPGFSFASDSLSVPAAPAPEIAQTPLPAAAWMLLAALGGLAGLGARRRRA